MGNLYSVSGTTGDVTTAGSFISNTTTSGLLFPRLTTVERNAISSPLAGMQIYNTDTMQDEFYNGTVWAAVSSGGGGGFSPTPSVQNNTNTSTLINSNTYTDTTVGIASFALSDATHKVKISLSGTGSVATSSAIFLTVFVDGSNIASNSSQNSFVYCDNSSNAGVAVSFPVSFTVQYAPGDTSAHSYEIFAQNGGAGSGRFPVNNNSGYILLEEII